MNKHLVKKILMVTGSVFLVFVAVLAVHIYIVTRPKAPDPNLRAMARIDIQQEIAGEDSTKIIDWLYRQKGVDHVLCNPQSAIVVFTFFPVKTTAAKVFADFKSNLAYKAVRIIPSEKDLKSGCPVASTSGTYKVYNFFKNLF
ncbi:hypothetical protein ACX0G9_05985 [Flavitalea flava]